MQTRHRLVLFQLWLNLCPTHTTIPRVNIKKENSYDKLRRPHIPREVVCEHESSVQWTMENLIKERVEKQTAVESTMMRKALKPNSWGREVVVLNHVKRTGEECTDPACLEMKRKIIDQHF